jgi:lauroyl/myristoyl acyltransferase
MVNYFLYKFGQFVALCFPLKISYKIAVFFSDIHYFFADQDRAGLKANLEAIFPGITFREIRSIRIRALRNFAKYLVDFFRYPVLDKEYAKKNLSIENAHYFDEALAKGKGVIALSAHLGNWEMGGVAIAFAGYPLSVVALTHKSKKVDDFFNARRESKGVKVIPFAKAVRQSLNLLKDNQMVALVGDRDFTKEGGIIVDFFGKPTSLPKGPAALALKTGAAIVSALMVRNPDDSFTLKVGKPIYANPENDLKEIVNQYKIILEECIKKYPDQWYVFRKFWVE